MKCQNEIRGTIHAPNVNSCAATIVALSIASTAHAAVELVTNGTFDSDTSGWAASLTANGANNLPDGTTEPFETVSGTSSNAAAFQVGKNDGTGADGGVLFSQVIAVDALSDLTFSADVAAFNPSMQVNASGGDFVLRFGGATIGTFPVGQINDDETLRGSLSGQLMDVAAGSYTLAFLITRKFSLVPDTPEVTPKQYIDNVSVMASPVPLPATLPLIVAGLLGLGYLGRGRKKTSEA